MASTSVIFFTSAKNLVRSLLDINIIQRLNISYMAIGSFKICLQSLKNFVFVHTSSNIRFIEYVRVI